MKPSEPSSPGENDIQPAKHETTASPDRGLSEDPRWGERVLPSLVLPDLSRRFSIFEALIVLVCCVGCCWLGITGRLVNSSSHKEDYPNAFICGPRLSTGDMACNFLLGLGPACPLILLNQYFLRGRRSWPKVHEWVWLWTALGVTVMVCESTLPRSCLDAIETIIPKAVGSFFFDVLCFGPCFLPVVWLLVLCVELPGMFSRGTWTDWLSIVSVPLLLFGMLAWVASRIPQWS